MSTLLDSQGIKRIPATLVVSLIPTIEPDACDLASGPSFVPDVRSRPMLRFYQDCTLIYLAF
jgi:hypothetical protein